LHTYPIVLVSASGPQEAQDAAASWLDSQLRDGSGAFDYGNVAEGPDTELCLKAGTEGFKEAVKDALAAEEREEIANWMILKQLVLAFKDKVRPPEDDEKFTEEYELPVGYNLPGLKAGTPMKHESTAGQGIWRGHKLWQIYEHRRGSRADIKTANGLLYDNRDDNQGEGHEPDQFGRRRRGLDVWRTKGKKPLELTEADPVWAVVLDCHY